MLANLPDHADFLANLKTRFRVTNVLPEPLDLELIRVSALKEGLRQRSFSIHLLGPAQWPMPQHIYHLQHETLGEMDLFLVPVSQQAGGYEYEAVFHFIVETDSP